MLTLAWFYTLILLGASTTVGTLPLTADNRHAEQVIRHMQGRSAVNVQIGMEALRKVLHQSRLLFSNGYDKVFLKAGGYRQAITDFKSVDPKLLQDSIQTGELMGAKGNLILKVYKPEDDSPRMSIEIHKLYKRVPTDPPQNYFIFYNKR